MSYPASANRHGACCAHTEPVECLPLLPAPPPFPASPASRGARARRGQQGFTLVELTVVVVIISVFALMAIPQVTLQLKDRRTHEAAQRVALIYQQARVRAMGQGGAILVRYGQGTSGFGAFETREALIGNDDLLNCALVPSASCTQTDWDNTARAQFRSIEAVDFGTDPALTDVFATLTPESTSANGNDMDVCFTPLGRAFVRYNATDPFTPLRGVPVVNVYRGQSKGVPDGLPRRVLVLPTGIARLQL
jgi:prepilin-type N-terminal cleavage/methylation domain-containing protein